MSPYLPQARQEFSGFICHLGATFSSSVMCVCMIVYVRVCVCVWKGTYMLPREGTSDVGPCLRQILMVVNSG